jgi:hypothetical protein
VSNGVAEALTGGSFFRGLRSCHLDEPWRCVSGGRNVHDIPGQAVPLRPHQSENSRLRSSNAAVAFRTTTNAQRRKPNFLFKPPIALNPLAQFAPGKSGTAT